jgi:hypothetical protein
LLAEAKLDHQLLLNSELEFDQQDAQIEKNSRTEAQKAA